MKAVFLDYRSMGPDLDLTELESLVDSLDVHETTQDDELSGRLAGATLAFTNKIRFTEDVLAAAPTLKYIGLTATGTDNIDLDGARAAGVVVSNIRAYCTPSVVEHTFGTLLMLTHRLGSYADFVDKGHWQEAETFSPLSWPITELAGKTIGIVGYGELGRGVARVAEAFGMRVLVADRKGQAAARDGRVPFDEVLAEADVLSLHCPLTAGTHKLIDGAALDRMKPTALLLNTARGGLVDSAALADALSTGRIGGAAIDVLPQEPPRDGDPLLDYKGDNLIVTPHIAWATREARQAAIDQLVENARAFLEGSPRNRVV
jgi:glycerate dehydrogenase